jgi:hypothetical protein
MCVFFVMVHIMIPVSMVTGMCVVSMVMVAFIEPMLALVFVSMVTMCVMVLVIKAVTTQGFPVLRVPILYHWLVIVSRMYDLGKLIFCRPLVIAESSFFRIFRMFF